MPTKPTKRTDKVVEWKSETFMLRIDKCRAMLSLHGYLTEAENNKVRSRITKVLKEQDKDSRHDATNNNPATTTTTTNPFPGQ